MDEGKVYGRGIGFPPRLGHDGRWAWSAGPRNIRESIRIILLTDFEERLMLSSFGGGLTPFLFEPNVLSTHRLIQDRITQVLAQWEPRIKVVSVDIAEDPVDKQTAVVKIIYQLIATGSEEQVGLNIQFSM